LLTHLKEPNIHKWDYTGHTACLGMTMQPMQRHAGNTEETCSSQIQCANLNTGEIS